MRDSAAEAGDTCHLGSAWYTLAIMRRVPAESPSAWSGAAALFRDACLLIRDIFLYALPGGLFFTIALFSHRLNLAQIGATLAPYHPPTWALALLMLAACYLAGHLLFAIISLRVEFWKLMHWSDPDWLAEYPNEVTARDVVLRHYFPDAFREMDRHEASMRFVFSCTAALLIGWLIFVEFQPSFSEVIIGAAILIFVATLTWMTQLGRMRKAIHAGGEEIEEWEKAARESEAVIQPSGEELRFIIDSIFRAAELSTQRQASGDGAQLAEPKAEPPEPPAETERAGAESESGASEPGDSGSPGPSAHAAAAHSFGTPRL